MQDLGATSRHLHHFLIADLGDATGARHDPRIGGIDTVDVCVNLAVVGTEGGCQGDSRGVRGAATQGRHVLGVLCHPLEPGHDDDVVAVEG
jgi:hypothetical protein